MCAGRNLRAAFIPRRFWPFEHISLFLAAPFRRPTPIGALQDTNRDDRRNRTTRRPYQLARHSKPKACTKGSIACGARLLDARLASEPVGGNHS
jgi:hypothetical protein